MASTNNFFFVLLICLTFFNVQVFSQCIDYYDAIDRKVQRDVACPLVTDDLYKRSFKDEPKIQLAAFSCNNVSKTICDKVKDTFEVAGRIISKTFILNTPVLISVNYTNMCAALPDLCNVQLGRFVVGGAQSARDMLMLDDDGITRYYPQSLVKQFKFKTHPKFATFDVVATFNSLIKWHFPSDKDKIQPFQVDFLYTVVHEMIHGLGFFSNWRVWLSADDLNQTLVTPFPDVDTNDKKIVFKGFKEYVFDKYIIFNRDRKPLSQITAKLNEFAKVGSKFKDFKDMTQHFIHSKQLKLAEFMNKIGTTPKTLSVSCFGEDAILDTALVPFQSGGSVTHFQQSNINTTDFLMSTFSPIGKTLDDVIKQTGAKSAFGPKLQAVMECIGLATKRRSNPYRPSLAPEPRTVNNS